MCVCSPDRHCRECCHRTYATTCTNTACAKLSVVCPNIGSLFHSPEGFNKTHSGALGDCLSMHVMCACVHRPPTDDSDQPPRPRGPGAFTPALEKIDLDLGLFFMSMLVQQAPQLVSWQGLLPSPSPEDMHELASSCNHHLSLQAEVPPEPAGPEGID